MTIYIEYAIIDNFIISYLVISMSSLLTKITIKKSKILILSCFYTLFALFLPLIQLNIFAIFILKILFTILICLLAINNFQLKSKFFLFYFTFLTLNLITFAICFLISKLLGSNTDSLVMYNLDFPIATILLAIYIYFKILLSYFAKLKKSYDIDEFIYEVNVIYKSKKIKLNAFLDTGNTLIDEKSKLPVAITSFDIVQNIISKNEALCILLKKDCSTINNLHYIKFSTASSKDSLMPVFMLDNLEIVKKGAVKNVNCMLGVSFGKISNGNNYDMLLGLKMLK